MRPRKYPYSQKRIFPSQKRVDNYNLAIEELNMLMPTASESLKGKIEQAKLNRLNFLKPWDFDFFQD
ncbi:hypothetical protein ADO07_01569 [Streptococcus parauberis]|nr:hypothetical protein ADO07_01569 [Streptococcus parauberis]